MKHTAVQADQLRSILSVSTLFNGVDLMVIDAELRASRTLDIEAGQVLLDPKRPNSDIYLVLAGQLLVCLEPRITEPLVRIGVGECVGELSIIDAAPPSAYVVSSIQSRLLAISKPVLWRMLALQQVMALNLLHVLSQRIRENNAVLLASLEIQRKYRNQAEIDALTGLHNRSWFEEVFPKQLELCERVGQHASLLMLDIDHFKQVNDRYGHQSGDKALRHIGTLLTQNLCSTDLCARYGGEELIVLMPGTEITQAKLTADRVREGIAQTPMHLADGREVQLCVSGGIAQWQPGANLDALIRDADQALYQAKEAGRNQVIASVRPQPLGVTLT